MMFAEWSHSRSVSEVAVGDCTVDLQFDEFRRITQEELNGLISDLSLPKSKAELLRSRLQLWNILKKKCHNFSVS